MSSEEESTSASAATLQGEGLKALLKESLREIFSEDPGLLSSLRPESEEGGDQPSSELVSSRLV